MKSWDEIEHYRQLEKSTPFWRCEECGHESHTKPMPKDRAKFYARNRSDICPKCKSESFVPVGF